MRKRYTFIWAVALCMVFCMAGCGFSAGPVSISLSEPGGDAGTEAAEDAGTEAAEDAGSSPGKTETEETTPVSAGRELIPEGGFAEGADMWGLYLESGGAASKDLSQGRLVVKISDPGRVAHAVQLYRDGFELLEGGKYHFSADISSDAARTIDWRIQVNGGDYHPYAGMEGIAVGPEETTVSCDFVMSEPTDPAPRMCFNLGDANREQNLGAHKIYFDNVSLVITDETEVVEAEAKGKMMDVNIDQAGYRPSDHKRAVIRIKDKRADTFTVTDMNSGQIVFEGSPTEGNTGGTSGDHVMYADFSDLKRPGRYRVDVPGTGSSYEFTIASDVYDGPLKDALKMLYLQRCGSKLPEKYAGSFAHEACHTEEAALYDGEGTIDVSGGWHDAGDYGRYTPPAAKAVADLMLAYELYPSCFGDDLGIPESGNGIPDILDEARYELEWMLKMQRSDGMVYHKVTGLKFDGICTADKCTEKLYVMPPSKTATADFSAAMYMASRIYRDADEAFSDRCLEAAKKAVMAYKDHIDERNFVNPPDVLTGEYGDGNSTDEFLWALFEGYKTTKDPKLAKLVGLADISRIEDIAFGWANVSGYAMYAFLTCDEPMQVSFDPAGMFYDHCEELCKTCLYGEAYGSTLTENYPWGSNMTIANNGMALLIGYSLTGKEDYLLCAKQQLHYLFGANPNSYCFLTGWGTQCPTDPHHRPSQAVGECMKGMLVGGADSGLDDPYAKAVLADLPKARCYVDSSQSYSTNEVTIYWNSPLCFLLAGYISAP